MSQLIDCLGMQYAVIEALRTETAPERFVIAYREEESLRDLIAARSIIAVGFVSREEAEATIEARVSAAAASMQMPSEAVVIGADQARRISQLHPELIDREA